MTKKPFKLKSSNSPLFKNIGSSTPIKSFWTELGDSKIANVLTGGASGAVSSISKGDWKGAGKSMLSGGSSSVVGEEEDDE